MEAEENKNPTPKKWDTSILIAFLAVLISSFSAIISFKENKIMMEQQQLFANQQEASVWPFLQNTPANEYESDSIGVFRLIITNKGVGPAIIGEVRYTFDGVEIDGWALHRALRARYGDTLLINQIQNAALDKVVLAPREKHVVITEKITIKNREGRNLNTIINEINRLYKLEYCYCSVYGKCWLVSGMEEVRPSDKCEFRSDIR